MNNSFLFGLSVFFGFHVPIRSHFCATSAMYLRDVAVCPSIRPSVRHTAVLIQN